MLREMILSVAHRPFVRKLMTGGAGRRVALRFVAGESLDDGLRATRDLASQGFHVSLDYLGENVSSLKEADAATGTYRDAIERVAAAALPANLSVKLTQLGLDVDAERAYANAASLADAATRHDATVTLDMEDHRYTERTVETCLRLDKEFPGRVGIALQTYLFRTPSDLERLLQVPIRLCKGAYKEASDIAHPRKRDVDRAFSTLLTRLMRDGRYPMIATHDERLIRFALRRAEATHRDRETFEFQMLYGIRTDLQRRLAADGYRVRIYVPFGSHWYPYLVRRLAERPANLLFFASQLGRRRA